MIVCFEAELGYEGPSNAFILSNNLASALKDPAIVEKKLRDNLASGRVMQVQELLTPPFIYLPLGLVPKQDESWRKIHHLSHPQRKSVNQYVPDGAGELRYTCFYKVLKRVIRAGRHCIILKSDIKDDFRNVPVTP